MMESSIRSVLLVEDNPGDVRLLHHMFQEDMLRHIDVTCRDRISQAELHLANHPVDIILLDLGLPDACDLDAVRRMQTAAPRVPVVVLTGLDDERMAARALQEGAQDYLIKGQVATRDLLRSLRYAVTRKALDEALIMEKEVAQRAHSVAVRASQAKSSFLASISHELRTPLNGVLGYAHLLQVEGGLNAVQAARVDAMLEAGAHLLQMINSVLDLSTIEAERLVLHAVPLDPVMVAKGCLATIRPAAAVKALTLTVDVHPGVPSQVIADLTRLRQIVLNLLGNAIKFTAHGSIDLRLMLSADRAKLRLEVADTGPGVSPAHRELLYQRFERLGADSSGLIEGSGLGLALSARFAVLMGGQLGYYDNPSGGSVFWLELPLVAGSPAPHPPGTPPCVAKPAATAPLRILVVDDIAMNRDIASCFLRAAGHDVTCAEGAIEALAAVASHVFDVVLMDVRMPLIDGLEAARRIRCLSGPPGRVPIVALTAQAFTEQVEECRRAGMDSHLAKPFTPQSLLDAVQAAVAVGEAQQHPAPAGRATRAWTAPRPPQSR